MPIGVGSTALSAAVPYSQGTIKYKTKKRLPAAGGWKPVCPRRAASRSPAQSRPWPAAPGPWGSDLLAPCPYWVAPHAVTPSAPASGRCSAPSRCWIHQQRCVAPLPPPLHRPEGPPLVTTNSTQSSTPWYTRMLPLVATNSTQSSTPWHTQDESGLFLKSGNHAGTDRQITGF